MKQTLKFLDTIPPEAIRILHKVYGDEHEYSARVEKGFKITIETEDDDE